MLKDNKHIDSLFADGLKNLSVTPNPKVWNGINSQLLNAKKKRRLVIYMWTGIAASILILLAIGNQYFMGQPNYDMQLNTISENTNAVQSNLQPDTDQIANTKANTNTKKEQSNNGNASDQLRQTKTAVTAYSQGEFTAAETVKSEADVPVNSNASEERRLNSEQGFLSRDSNLAFLDQEFLNVATKPISVGKLSNFGNKLPTQLVPNTSQLNKNQDYTLLADEIQIQKNLLAIDHLSHEKSKENRWSIIGQVSSSYSSYSGDSKGNNIESGIWSVGGGAKVSYAMSDKFAMQTGIVYNRFGQDMSSGGRGDGLMYSDANIVPSEEMSKGLVNYPSQTAAGPIKLSGGNRTFASPSVDEVRSSYSTSDDLMQNFKSIEIPLLMRYNLIQKRVGMFVSGGLSANMIVGNGVYDQSQGNKKIGEIDGIRTTNFSSQFSFGLEYRLSPKLQIGLEPSVKYYLNSINTSSQYDYKPYSIGIFTGIRYDF